MAQYDFSQCTSEIEQAIGRMPEEFTDHQLITVLSQSHQRMYVDALYYYSHNPLNGSNAPFNAVHRDLSRYLYHFPHLIKRIGRVDSRNIFGNPSRCVKWRKIK